MMSQSAKYMQMMQAASKGLKVRGSDVYTNNTIIGVALEIVEHNSHIVDRRRLKKIIYEEAKKKFRRKNYRAIGWAWLLWWILPKVIDWFIVWWFSNSEYEIGLEP